MIRECREITKGDLEIRLEPGFQKKKEKTSKILLPYLGIFEYGLKTR